MLRVLCIGDVVGSSGTEHVAKNLFKVKNSENIDFTVVNAENAAAGNGLDLKNIKLLYEAGADVLTGGNHILKWHEIHTFLDESEYVLRPLNYPEMSPGKGFTILRARQGLRIMVINALGQVFMEPADNPFLACDRLLKEQEGKYDVCVCDFHAEATSEKVAFGRYFDGRIHIIFGTHTHVQTADETLLPKGSGYITDLGMSGPSDSVIGVKTENAIKNFISRVRNRYETASGECCISGAVFEVNTETFCVTGVKRIRY